MRTKKANRQGSVRRRGPVPWTGDPVSSLLIVHDGSDAVALALACYVQEVAARFVLPIAWGVFAPLVDPIKALGLVNDDVELMRLDMANGVAHTYAAQVDLDALPALFKKKKWPMPDDAWAVAAVLR